MNLREKLEKRSAGAERWDPKEGEILIGEVKDIQKITTQFGEGKIAEIQNENGTFTVFLTAVLKSQFLQKDVKSGTKVGVKYLGQIEGKGGRQYKNYAVEVDEDSREEDNQKDELPSADGS